jgi:hypothetical protein
MLQRYTGICRCYAPQSNSLHAWSSHHGPQDLAYDAAEHSSARHDLLHTNQHQPCYPVGNKLAHNLHLNLDSIKYSNIRKLTLHKLTRLELLRQSAHGVTHTHRLTPRAQPWQDYF